MIYRKLKRTWSNGYANYIPDFRDTFPELNKLSSEELCNRWIKLGGELHTSLHRFRTSKKHSRITNLFVWKGGVGK